MIGLLDATLKSKEQLKLIHMKRAVAEAVDNVKIHGGGPFGAIIVKGGEIVATGSNKVTISNDPTAHAEIVAIRNACQILGSHDLTDCELYTSCEPCPMCLSAVYWANMKHIYYSANRSDAEHFKFDDAFLYIELRKDKKDRNIPIEEVHLDNRCEPFEAWSAKPGKAVYGGNFVQTQLS